MSRQHFQRPSYDDDGETTLVMEERAGTSDPNDQNSLIFHNPHLSLSLHQQRSRLPISKFRNQLLYLIERYRCTVIVGATGSGKSTQVPQFLAEAGWADKGLQIGVTEPRRVAAITLASRVASEMQCSVGDKVGYVLRFNEVMSERTKIKFMTDGILLRELQNDPLLTKYSVVIIDEAHERSVTTDLILGLLRRIMTVRLDLRIVIMSATVDADLFREFFELNEERDESKNTAVILSVEGQMFPVSIFYTKVPVPNYVKATVEACINIHKGEKHGDILAFLTGQDEVEQVCNDLREAARDLKGYDRIRVLPLYSGLSQQQQIGVFDSAAYGTRKIIVATNIAETSVTIPGICFVVDCGFVKMKANNLENGIESLVTVKISKSSAKQRAGRAGRLLAGKCYRLYPESEYQKMLPSIIPEIQRINLAPVILQLKSLGIQNILKFNYISRPPSQLVIQALHLLYSLGAIDQQGLMTNPIGTTMAVLPLPPMHAKVLMTSAEFECSKEIVEILAMMQIQNVFNPFDNRHATEVVKRKFAAEEGDHLSMLNVYTCFVENGKSERWCRQNHLNYKGLNSADNIAQQLKRYMKKYNIPLKSCRGLIGDTARIRRCLLTGFFSQVAQYEGTQTGVYLTLRDAAPFKIYKGSTVLYCKEFPKYVLFTDVLSSSIRDVSSIDLEWLKELNQNYYDFGDSNEQEESNYDQRNLASYN